MTHPPIEPNPRVRLVTVMETGGAVYGAVIPRDYTGSDLDGYGLRAAPGAWALLTSALNPPTPPRPTVVCLCGSTRNYTAFQDANLAETLAGRIVLSIGCDTKADGELFGDDLDAVKAMLDELHRRKIDLADEVLVVSDPAGYFGESTRGEIAYARATGKPVRFQEPAAAERDRALVQLLLPEDVAVPATPVEADFPTLPILNLDGGPS